ncbi:MAG: hypothetical protein ACYS1C_00875 [Planctomycetota bacterium]
MKLMRWFRRHRVHLLAVLVVLLMLSWGIGGVLQRAIGRSDRLWGRIRGEPVEVAQVQRAAMTLSAFLRLGLADPQALLRLRGVALTPRAAATLSALQRDVGSFVFEAERRAGDAAAWRFLVLLREAEAAGVEVTADEASEILLLSPRLGGENGFSVDRYRAFIEGSELTDEGVTRAAIELTKVAKLINLRRESVMTSTAGLWMAYVSQQRRLRIRSVAVDAAAFRPLVKVSPEDLKEFYERHRNVLPEAQAGTIGYMAPERVKVEVAVAPIERYEDEVEVSDEEVASYYEGNRYLFLQQESADEREAREEGEEDGAEADAGAPPAGFRYRPLEDVRGTILADLRRQKARERAIEALRKVREALDVVSADYPNEPLPLAQMARRHGLDHRVPSTEQGRELLSRQELQEVVPHGAEVAEFAFESDSNLYYPVSFDADGDPLLCQVLEHRPGEPQPFAEVRDEVRRDCAAEEALQKARAFAQKLRDAVAERGIDAAAEEMGRRLRDLLGGAGGAESEEPAPAGELTVGESGLFSRTDPAVPGLPGSGVAVVEKAFELGPEQIGLAVEGPPVSRCYVFEVVERQDASGEEFAERASALRPYYLAARRVEETGEWMRGLLDAAELFQRAKE